MGCNCPHATRRSARLSAAATRKATRLANAGVRIKPAKPRKVPAKKAHAQKARPCHCK